jgi:hypothetical protein
VAAAVGGAVTLAVVAGSDTWNTPNGFNVSRLDSTANGLKYLACTLVVLSGTTASCARTEAAIVVASDRVASTVAIDRFVFMMETLSYLILTERTKGKEGSAN